MTTKATLWSIALVLLSLASGRTETPDGWFAAGSHPDDYTMTVDPTVRRGGTASARIECIAAKPRGFGTLMQSFPASRYVGLRIRLTAYLSTSNTAGAAPWMRIDGTARETLAFDNMQSRGWIKGTTTWKPYEIVLDVPSKSDSISFGVLLLGGTVWLDDLKIEPVGPDVPVTGIYAREAKLPSKPRNLDFEEIPP